MNLTEQNTISLTRADHAAAITASWRDSVAGIIQTGRFLLDAKAALPHGEFGKMFELREVPFSLRAGQMLMEIARSPVLSNAKNSSLLPLSWYTLYECTRLPEETLAECISDGRINAETERSEVEALLGNKLDVHFSSDSPEWYTPPEVVSRVVKALEAIDLDPCSNAAKNIPAEHHFTQADNGLSLEWFGRVYMNPPYGRAIGEWVEKLVSEYKSGNVKQAIALVPARVDTDWWKKFRECAVCFIDGRLRFSNSENSAPFPSAVVYLGSSIDRFDEAFSDMGDVWVRWQR